MPAVRAALWCAVLLSCQTFYVIAGHQSKDLPYKRSAISNTTAAILSTSLHDTAITLSSTSTSTLSATRTEQDASLPQVSSDVTSETRFSSTGTSSIEGVGVATFTDSRNEPFSEVEGGAGVRSSGARFIGSITTASRPRLTTPPNPTSHTNSPGSAFPTISVNTTNFNATTKGHYTNSSSATTTATTDSTIPLSVASITRTSTEDACTTTSFGPFATIISYSIVHTWTITWFGDPADYTPPFPPISTPHLCTPTSSATGRFTISVCDSSGQSCSLVHTTAPGLTATVGPTLTPGYHTETSEQRGMETTVTFLTTDKNPAVVFPTSPPPDYGGSPDAAGNVHSVAFSDEVMSHGSGPDYGNQATTAQDIKTAVITEPPPVTIVVIPSGVVIDSQTFTDNPAHPTSTVVVNSNTFIINPTQVEGVGATVTRPPSGSSGGVAVPSPTRTTIGAISVGIEGSSVTLDSTLFTIGPTPTTVVVRDQTITLGPGGIIFPSQTLGGIVFPSQTLVIPAAQDTTRLVFGAELITAIGSDIVAIDGTTTTYGPGSSTVTEVIDGETVLIGPSGIVAHDQTYGGSNAASTDTQFAVVGGATISQVGPTVVVIQGVTYTLNPLAAGQRTGQTPITTVVGGETITIGPEGVVISTWTLASPYASTTTIRPSKGPSKEPSKEPSNGAAVVLPTPMATNTDEKNGSPSPASKRPGWVLSACIATGTGVLGALLAL